jgi:hypothetical protein
MSFNPIITSEQRASFENDGFLHIPLAQHNLITNVSDLQGWTDAILSWPREKGKWMPYDELNTRGEKQLMRTEKIVDYFPPVKELLCGSGLHSLLKQLTGKVSRSLQAHMHQRLHTQQGRVLK